MISNVFSNTPSFGARIANTKYFENGLYEVMNRKSKLTLDEKVSFLNAIELIKNDDSYDEFVIDSINPKIENVKGSKIMIDGKVVKTNKFSDLNSNAVECVTSIINFAKTKYGERVYNQVFLKAKEMSEDVRRKEQALTDFVINNLVKNFGGSAFGLLDSQVKLAETYSDNI